MGFLCFNKFLIIFNGSPRNLREFISVKFVLLTKTWYFLLNSPPFRDGAKIIQKGSTVMKYR